MTKKEVQRNKLAADVATFLSNGGEIVQATMEDSKFFRDQMHKSVPQGERRREINRRSWRQRGGHAWGTDNII